MARSKRDQMTPGVQKTYDELVGKHGQAAVDAAVDRVDAGNYDLISKGQISAAVAETADEKVNQQNRRPERAAEQSKPKRRFFGRG